MRYGVALLAVAVALGLRLLLHAALVESSPFLAFVPAVLLASWLGGFGPGLFATALATLAGDYFFLPPMRQIGLTTPNQSVQVGLFVGIGVVTSAMNDRLARTVARFRATTEALSKSEERYRLLAGSLEQRVEERTSQLEEANRDLEAFGYTVSHDLRAPLRSIQGFAEALLEDYADRFDDVGRDYAHRIVAAAGRMDRLIQDLLAYSRLSRVQVVPQRVDLDAVVADAWEQVAGEAPSARLEVAGPLPAVRAHRGTLVQVLANLLSNASKFVPPGISPEVRVAAESRDGKVCLWVADNGIGIAPEHQERVFNVFERLHGGEAYPGTGIGLAIVRKGVEKMGGRAGVDSALGHGARFWIELPREETRNERL